MKNILACRNHNLYFFQFERERGREGGRGRGRGRERERERERERTVLCAIHLAPAMLITLHFVVCVSSCGEFVYCDLSVLKPIPVGRVVIE